MQLVTHEVSEVPASLFSSDAQRQAGESEETMRTVKISLPDNFPQDSATRVAIGYFSTWSTASYPVVSIYPDRYGSNRDMVAIYRNAPEGEPLYVIGAVWEREQERYSFHS